MNDLSIRFFAYVTDLERRVNELESELARVRTAPPPPTIEPTAGLRTVRRAASYLKCSARHVANLSKTGLLPRVKLGAAVRYRRADLDAAVARRAEAPAAVTAPMAVPAPSAQTPSVSTSGGAEQ